MSEQIAAHALADCSPKPTGRRKLREVWLAALAVLVGVGASGWVQRHTIMAWYFTKELATAPSERCGWYVDRLAPLGEHAVESLVQRLQTGDETAKVNCGWAMAELAGRWGTDHPASQMMSLNVTEALSHLDDAGRREGFNALRALLSLSKRENPSDWLTRDLCRVVGCMPDLDGEQSRPVALALAAQFMHQARPTAPSVLAHCGDLVNSGLKDRRPECRAHAIRLASAPGVELLERVAPLLEGSTRDPAPEVRVTALLALGSHEELLPTDDLLPYLHDSDGDVRTVCEQALKSRGLLGGHLQLARQMTDPQPQVRSRVPALVLDFPDLDTRLWLERLSRDGSPAVRAAVLRAAGETKEWRLADRMREMATADPSPTVRQIARYYLQEQLADPRQGDRVTR